MNHRLWERLLSAPVAVLGTVNGDGSAHLVPCVFAPLGWMKLVSAIDAKPKQTARLRRLTNVKRDPHATLLGHHYEDDWDRLWWVRADCLATVVETEPEGAAAALTDRYRQYADPPPGPWIVLEVRSLSGWSAAGD